MDANKFATMLHRSSIKIKNALVFAGLEWTLIVLLLINSLFQYMIVKFANYSGLKPPCLWCSRIDHLMEPRKCNNLHRDHLCKAHGEEVSKLGYCSTHQKLADKGEDHLCKATGVTDNDKAMVTENGAEGLVCSSCGVILEGQIYSPFVPIKPSNWDHFRYDIQKEILITEKSENYYYGKNDEKNSDHLEARLVYEDDFAAPENTEETKFKILEFMKAQEAENYMLVPPKDCDSLSEQVIHINVQDTAPYFLAGTEIALADMEEREQDVSVATEDVSPFIMSDTDTEVSIGTEIPDLNSTEDTYTEDNHCLHEETSASCTNFHAHYEHGSETDSQETVDLSTFMIELNDHKINSQSSVYFEINGNEEEKLCERPSSSDGHYHAHKTLLFHERKDSGAEESLEGSVISEFDDEVMTVDSLNSTLRAERKALNVVYAELEEERNASAIAASQTMAMINRLQEEKAAMQMEASHYRRMMEEKSEYDEEAMQVMNDLMVKMDRERQWLEKELELCREKLLDYEAKENMGMLVSDVLYFRDRFGNIDEERMSIVDQLKVLDDKHWTSSEDEQHFEDVRPFNQEGGKHLERSSDIGDEYENEEFSVHYNEFHAAITRFKLNDRRAAIKNEVDQLCDRMNIEHS